MSQVLDFKDFPFALKTVASRRFEGVLLCFNSEKSFQLFFQSGQLVHITSEKVEQGTDEALYELIGLSNLKMEWQPLKVHLSQANLNADTVSAFTDVLKILITQAKFNSPEQSQLPENFFGSSATRQVAKANNATSTIATETKKSQPSPYMVETNFLLPPGQQQTQLEELLASVPVKEQMEALTRAHFTGYLYYQSLDGSTDFGLVLFVDGSITDLMFSHGSEREKGMPVYQKLASFKARIQIFKVEMRLLKAFRAVISPDKIQADIAATKANFAGIMKAFANSQRDGIVLFYLDRLKLHYFFLFENGTQVGIYGTDSKSGHLEPLAAPLAWPGNDEDAVMTLMVAARFVAPQIAPKSEKSPSLPDNSDKQLTEPVQIQMVDPVDWNGWLRDIAGKSPSISKVKTPIFAVNADDDEEDNAYGF